MEEYNRKNNRADVLLMQVVKEPACTFAIASIATKKMRFVAVPTTAQMAAHGRMELTPFSGFALTTAQAVRQIYEMTTFGGGNNGGFGGPGRGPGRAPGQGRGPGRGGNN